jgi:hypothetical protein
MSNHQSKLYGMTSVWLVTGIRGPARRIATLIAGTATCLAAAACASAGTYNPTIYRRPGWPDRADLPGGHGIERFGAASQRGSSRDATFGSKPQSLPGVHRQSFGFNARRQ